jgi:hypothetical protein
MATEFCLTLRFHLALKSFVVSFPIAAARLEKSTVSIPSLLDHVLQQPVHHMFHKYHIRRLQMPAYDIIEPELPS